MNTQILEEATEWFVDINDGEVDADRHKSFNSWLRRSPEHVRAYIEIAMAWEGSQQLGAQEKRDIDALVAAAAREGNLIAYPGARNAQPMQSAPPRSDSRRGFAVAAGLLLPLLGAATWFWMKPAAETTYVTALGEQRSIVLPDGSLMEVSAKTSVRVHFTDDTREIELLEGRALFQAERDASRPFVVSSGGTTVRAVGTRFDVHRRKAATVVTVVDGRVAVNESKKQRPEVLLDAGEQLTIRAAGSAEQAPVAVNAAATTAWTQRKLIFDGASLADVVEEFNRYSSRPLVVEDIELGQFHIRGSFSAGDPGRLIDFLQHRFPVRVEETSTEIRISGR